MFSANFVLTILCLDRKKIDVAQPLWIVADQVACSTSVVGLAGACLRVIERQLSGVMNWSDAVTASWHDFAVTISELVGASGYLMRAAQMFLIVSADFLASLQRPAYTHVHCSSRGLSGLLPKHSRQGAREVIADVGS